MFGNLIFLILILLTLNLTPSYEIGNPWGSLGIGLSLYALLVAFIWIQRSTRSIFINLQILTFFVLFHLFLCPFDKGVWLSLGSLVLFFGALYAHHRSFSPLRFLLPFVLPFIGFDIMAAWITDPTVSFFASVAFLVGLVLFFPFVMRHSWGCEPFPEGELKERLDALCKRVGFKHAGLLSWPAMSHMATAAIVGVIRPVRYVIFTPRLLEALHPHEVEAVLAHEIGHSQRRHLLFYPFIILGMSVVLALFAYFVGEPLSTYFALKKLGTPSAGWSIINQLVHYAAYATIVILYFRLLFGLYSRLFERQADLHCFLAGVPVESMIGSLDGIAIASGNIHRQPSWHHYSIQQRMDFLERAARQPELIERHHKKVKKARWLYTIAVLALTALAVSPYWPANNWLGKKVAHTSEVAAARLTRTERQKLTNRIMTQLSITDSDEAVKAVVGRNLLYYATYPRGVVEYATAGELYYVGEYEQSATFLRAAWRQFSAQERERWAGKAVGELATALLPHLSDDAGKKLIADVNN